MTRWPAYLVALALAFLGGRLSKHPEVRTETKTIVQERVQWREKIVTVASKNESAAKQENVRVVTKWLRPDGTISREQTHESARQATKTTQQSVGTLSQAQGSASLESKSVTASAPTYQRRLQAGGLIGLDLRDRAARRYGAYATFRVASVFTVGGWWVPGMTGASLGVTF